MWVLTVVSVESLLNRIHICSSQHASGSCSIYKPKQKKHKQQQNYYKGLDSKKLENR